MVLYLLGVHRHYQNRGIGKASLGWFLSGLPAMAAASTCTLATSPGNEIVRNWLAKLDAKKGATTEDGTLMYEFTIIRACQVLSAEEPSGPRYTHTPTYKGWKFVPLYAGRCGRWIVNDAS